jgi:hypothetical protein
MILSHVWGNFRSHLPHSGTPLREGYCVVAVVVGITEVAGFSETVIGIDDVPLTE